MAYESGLVALRVTNETEADISKGGFRFPGDSVKEIVVPASAKRMFTSREGLRVVITDEDPPLVEDGQEVTTDRPFSFVKDQDQNVTNRSPGQSDDWLKPTSAEATATPALKHGRLSEVRLEKGAGDRATDLGVDLYAVSGTGEEGLVTVRDVENAYEGISGSPAAGVKGGADLNPRDEGVLHLQDEVEVLATNAARSTAEEAGVELYDVEPTGSGGRITVADVKAHVEHQNAQAKLEAEQREAIDYQKKVDTATPPVPHISGPVPDPEGQANPDQRTDEQIIEIEKGKKLHEEARVLPEVDQEVAEKSVTSVNPAKPNPAQPDPPVKHSK